MFFLDYGKILHRDNKVTRFLVFTAERLFLLQKVEVTVTSNKKFTNSLST